MTEREALLASVAREHDCVVSLAELAWLGFGKDAVALRVARGQLTRLMRGVYLVGPGPVTRRGRFRAALLAGGRRSVLLARSAAAQLGMRPDGRSEVDVATVRASRPGLRAHRVVVPECEVIEVDGLRTSCVGRTLVDLAATRPHHVQRAIVRAEKLGIFDLFELEAVIARAPTRPGVRAVRRALEEYHPLAPRCRSFAELSFLLLVTGAGLPRPEVNNLCEGFEVDFRWGRLIVEIDGPDHDTAHQRARDAERDAILGARGHVVLRVPVARLRREPTRVLAEVRRRM